MSFSVGQFAKLGQERCSVRDLPMESDPETQKV